MKRMYEHETMKVIGLPEEASHCASCHEDYDEYGYDMDYDFVTGGIELNGTLCCDMARLANEKLHVPE